MAIDNLTNLGSGIVADMVCVRAIDAKDTWTPAERERITNLLKHLKDETRKVLDYYRQRRNIEI